MREVFAFFALFILIMHMDDIDRVIDGWGRPAAECPSIVPLVDMP